MMTQGKRTETGICSCGGTLLTPAKHRTPSARYPGDTYTRKICQNCGLLPLNNADCLNISRTKAKRILATCCKMDNIHGFKINPVSEKISGSIPWTIHGLLEHGFRKTTIKESIQKAFNKNNAVAKLLKTSLQ